MKSQRQGVQKQQRRGPLVSSWDVWAENTSQTSTGVMRKAARIKHKGGEGGDLQEQWAGFDRWLDHKASHLGTGTKCSAQTLSTAIVLTSHLQLYPFTSHTTLNMSQKQNSAAPIQFAFCKSICAHVLSISSRTSKWVNSVFWPMASRNHCFAKAGTPCARSHGKGHRLVEDPLSL